ncbi:PQQ-dependent sugar dehydrogenase, partial [Planctomycetota bacterium]
NGQLIHPNLAAVTRISDLDNNGVYEYFHDVITELPGARGPDTLHQNNEIAFDDEGNLFLAVGSNDDRSLDDHPWGGTILKATPDFQDIEIIAKGLRNPFGIAVTKDEEGNDLIYLTDNDVRSNRGDEVNVARKGSHFGHPFVVGMDKAESAAENGFDYPIWMGPPNGNLTGIVYLGSQFGELAGCVLVLDHAEATITLIRPNSNLGGEVEAKQFMRVSSPIDAVATSSGEVYVLTRDYTRLYRIRPQTEPGE